MNKPLDQDSFEYHTQHARELVSGVNKFKIFAAKLVFYAGAIYGAVTFNPYYFAMGVAGIALFWWLERRMSANDAAALESVGDVEKE